MANSVTNVAVAALVGAGVAIIAGVAGIDRLLAGNGKRMVHAEIHLNRIDGGGPCVIHTSPQTLEAFKRETIQWTIIDTCGVTPDNEVEVVFANDPLAEGCIPRGGRKIQCALKPSAGYATYKYEVRAAGAQTEDPELEIVQ